MVTLQYVGIDTSLYTTQSPVPDPQDCNEDGPPDDSDDEPIHVQFYDGMDVTPNDGKLLLFFYYCKTTRGNHHCDHIIEVAATVTVPDGLPITSTQFSSLRHSSRHIPQKGNKYTTCASNIPFFLYQYQKNVESHYTCCIITQCFPQYSRNC